MGIDGVLRPHRRRPDQVLRAIPGVMQQLDPNLPVESLKTLPQQVKENVFMDRMISTLSAAFALLATLLAAVGLYGVLAYSVAQRTREIGVRMALGADGARVRGMVLRQVAVMTLIGGVIGIAGALGDRPRREVAPVRARRATTRGDRDVRRRPHDRRARRRLSPGAEASRVDPMQALRYE